MTAPAEIGALRGPAEAQRADEFVEFQNAGTLAHGIFCCVACGQTVVATYQLLRCPSCGGGLWEEPGTSPFNSTHEALLAPVVEYAEWAAEELESTAGLFCGALLALASSLVLWCFLAAAAYVLLR
jgi:hypothetical protein